MGPRDSTRLAHLVLELIEKKKIEEAEQLCHHIERGGVAPDAVVARRSGSRWLEAVAFGYLLALTLAALLLVRSGSRETAADEAPIASDATTALVSGTRR
jgi:hypothetical protein